MAHVDKSKMELNIPTTPKSKQKVSHSHGHRKFAKKVSSNAFDLRKTPEITSPERNNNQPPLLVSATKSSNSEAKEKDLTETSAKSNTGGAPNYYKLSFDQDHYLYRQVLRAAVLSPTCNTELEGKALSKQHKLLEDIRQTFGVENDLHEKLVQTTKAQKENGDQDDLAESEQCTVEEFHYVVKAMYRFAIKKTAETPKFKQGDKPFFQQLATPYYDLIKQFAAHNHFSKVTQRLVEAVVVMELCSDKYCPCIISEKLLKDCLVSFEMDWQNMQFDAQAQNSILTNVENAMFDKAASTFTSHLVTHMKVEGCVPKLFPVQNINLDQLNKRVSLIVTVLNMNAWNNSDTARKEVTALAIDQIQNDVKDWVIETLFAMNTFEEDLDDADNSIISHCEMLVKILNDATLSLQPRPTMAQYFFRLGVEYFKVVSLELAKRLSSKCMEVMLEMDKYQVTYHKQPGVVLKSSSVTLQLYFALRDLFGRIREHVTDRDLFKTHISSYQSWFDHAVMFWLQTFRSECIKRMEKSLEIEKDIVQVTSLVKYSNSSVDVVSCFSKVTSEWKDINVCDADIAVLGCTKILDTICDCATQYCERLHMILEKNGYYDFIDNALFDVTDQLCITLNNIMHVRKYLHELPTVLNCETACESLGVKYEDKTIGDKASAVLDNLIKSADYDMMLRCRIIIKDIVEQMTVDFVGLTKQFTQKAPDKKSSLDQMFGYLDTNLEVLYEKLESMIFPLILDEIWYALVDVFKQTMLKGKQPEYYTYLTDHLSSLRGYILRGMDSDTTDSCPVYCNLMQELEQHSMTSHQLVLMYYQNLCNNNTSSSENGYGSLTTKIAFARKSEGQISLFCKVCQANNLPVITSDRTIDPVVTVEIHPHTLYQPKHVVRKTSVQENCNNPVYNGEFEFPDLNNDVFEVDGCVLIFTLWHHESILPDDFIGEVIVPLNCLDFLPNGSTIDTVPSVTLPFTRPERPSKGPFMILQERQKKEKEADKLVTRRAETTGWGPKLVVFSSLINALVKAKGKHLIISESTFQSSSSMSSIMETETESEINTDGNV